MVKTRIHKHLQEVYCSNWSKYVWKAIGFSWNSAWAKENPIHFQVTKNEAGELELQLAPKLDPETH